MPMSAGLISACGWSSASDQPGTSDKKWGSVSKLCQETEPGLIARNSVWKSSCLVGMRLVVAEGRLLIAPLTTTNRKRIIWHILVRGHASVRCIPGGHRGIIVVIQTWLDQFEL